jgi:hypothetical protein
MPHSNPEDWPLSLRSVAGPQAAPRSRTEIPRPGSGITPFETRHRAAPESPSSIPGEPYHSWSRRCPLTFLGCRRGPTMRPFTAPICASTTVLLRQPLSSRAMFHWSEQRERKRHPFVIGCAPGRRTVLIHIGREDRAIRFGLSGGAQRRPQRAVVRRPAYVNRSIHRPSSPKASLYPFRSSTTISRIPCGAICGADWIFAPRRCRSAWRLSRSSIYR